MELADQWRREWAGTAEYGNVTEGGVTRRVARAMEVLHASKPGTKVRVMRAAYHSTSGPGLPASSFMLHSSRRVISSGFNLLESPTFPTKPLEISSMPLDSLSDYNTETRNYKVTEPDDTEISEPSKWKGGTNSNTIRMPSEESSSTDNASIIDLDKLSHREVQRKYSYDSENSDLHSYSRNSARTSPLLDAPSTLSTLKYRSLLNSSNEWNNRRKSYSFEDTSPLNETILQSNDTLAMESSTDSGICKSSEKVNDYAEDSLKKCLKFDQVHSTNDQYFPSDEWHIKNMLYENPKIYKDHSIVVKEPRESNISLQSAGKVSITVPITIETDENSIRNTQTIEENDRKVKKVEFCKTELHFAAESGKVNIIATDEKPPPNNDFRKRRSAFVPINNKFEKPITLFGDKNDFSTKKFDEYELNGFIDSVENDENTAATKSILKNKIPKPKPYLLGENMKFGDFNKKEDKKELSFSSGVTLINKQLQTKGADNHDFVHYPAPENDESFRDTLRTYNKGSIKHQSFKNRNTLSDVENVYTEPSKESEISNLVKKQLKKLHMTPSEKLKTRQLRESDLTYFGINERQNMNDERSIHNDYKNKLPQMSYVDSNFKSVRLIKLISNSAQNSETESEDLPEYQNFPMKTNFAPVPIPRLRVKQNNLRENELLKSINEQTYDDVKSVTPESRRSRSKTQESAPSSRSLSEPSKKRSDIICRNDEFRSSIDKNKRYKNEEHIIRNKRREKIKDEVPLYVNVKILENAENLKTPKTDQCRTDFKNKPIQNNKETNKKGEDHGCSQIRQNSVKKNGNVRRTEKLSTPDSTKLRHNNTNKNKTSTNKVDNKIDVVRTEQLCKGKDKDLKAHRIKTDEDSSLGHRTNSSRYSTKEKPNRNLKPLHNDHDTATKELTNKDLSDKDNAHERRSRKTEYVIKYDDKNGTVSSVSKVKSGHSSSRKKHASKDRKKDISKDTNKDKQSEKAALRNAAPRTSQNCKRKV